MLWSTGRTLNIVAHEDDDLLFLSPDLLQAIKAGRTIRTVFLTAGDSGAGTDYWHSREVGVQAAYAQMYGSINSWIQTDAGITGYPISVFTLSDHPSISLVFMRLPDGNTNGSGFASTNYKSLQLLWTNEISIIETIDGLSTYSNATLTNTLTNLISAFQPDQINTQDYAGTYGDGDHSDHHSVAYFVQAAVQRYMAPYNLKGYEGYTTSSRLANVSGADLIAKQNAFYAYAHHDRFVEGVPKIFPAIWRMNVRLRRIVFLLRSCVDKSYAAWLQRQYIVDMEAAQNQPNIG